MSVSGINLTPEAIDTYTNRFKKANTPIAFLIFNVLGEKKVEVTQEVLHSEVDEKLAEAEAAGFKKTPEEPKHYALLRHILLSDNLPKYATIYVEPGANVKKLVLITWCPDDAPVRPRMLAASTKDALKKKLDGIQVVADCNDHDEVNYKEIAERCKK